MTATTLTGSGTSRWGSTKVAIVLAGIAGVTLAIVMALALVLNSSATPNVQAPAVGAQDDYAFRHLPAAGSDRLDPYELHRARPATRPVAAAFNECLALICLPTPPDSAGSGAHGMIAH